MISQTATIVTSSTPGTGHCHRWRIDEANGPTSQGVCRLCGAGREFKNWLPEADVTTRTERTLAA